MNTQRIIQGILVFLLILLTGCSLREKKEIEIILKVPADEVIRSMSSAPNDTTFQKAIMLARELHTRENKDFFKCFEKAWHEINTEVLLSYYFSTIELRDKIGYHSTNEEVFKVLEDEYSHAITNTVDVIQYRISQYDIPKRKWSYERMNDKIQITFKSVTDPKRLIHIITAQGKLEFWENYDQEAIYEEIMKSGIVSQKAYASERDTILYNSPISGSYFINTPTIIYSVFPEDTARVMKYLKTAKEKGMINVRDVKFLWGIKKSDEGKLDLYALKITSRDGRALLDNNEIENARVDFNPETGKPYVNIMMTRNGTRKWALFTEKNTDKFISIVFDDRVYMTPRVNNKITTGNCWLTGQFTVDEAKDLASILRSGSYPVPVQIINCKVSKSH